MLNKYIKLLSKIGPYRKERLFILLLCAVAVLLDTAIPYLIGELVNFVKGGYEFNVIFQLGLVIVVVGFMNAIFDTFQNYRWHLYSVKFSNYFRKEMLKSTLDKEPKFFKEHNEDFTSKILHDSSMVADQISIGFPMLVLNILRIVLVLGLMIFMSIKLTIIVVLVLPIYLMFFQKTDRKMRDSSNRERSKFTILTDDIREFVEGVFQIHIYQKEKFFVNKFADDINSYEKELKQIKWYTALGYGINQVIKVMLPIIILVFGAYEVIMGRMLIGSLFAFYFYLNFLYEPIINLSNWVTSYQIAMGMSDRVFEFLEKEECKDGVIEVKTLDDITLKDVTFSYDGENNILDKFNLELKKGDILGVVGPSGSGKSTLINILLKVFDNYEGNIFVNGNELKDISRSDYYKKISYIQQDSFLFRGSVKENIEFDADDENKLQESIQLAHLKVNNVLDGVESQGKNFSGGEKQRISIARALYKDADLIILDEFTSALDLEVEKEIVEDINNNVSKDKIIIIITHRKLPLSICNKVIDLEKIK